MLAKMAEPVTIDGQTSSGDNKANQAGQDGVPLVFLQESSLFGQRKPTQAEWLKHAELFHSIGTVIDSSHITGLQRVNGFWRIYLDNLSDKVALMAQGVPLRGKNVPILRTNPNRLDSENTTKVRIKNIPLSVDDDSIIRVLTLKGLEVISSFREKLRIDGKLTNCATGDRILIVKSSTLKEPLPPFMVFGKFKGRVIHLGQKNSNRRNTDTVVTCLKCLDKGHVFAQCTNDWKCRACLESGHKEANCNQQNSNPEEPDPDSSCSETDDTDDVTSTQDDGMSKTSEHVEVPASASHTTDTPRRPKRRGKRNVGNMEGQQTITEMIAKSNKGSSTPASDKRAPSTRSPPTPAEQLHDNSKKAKS